MIRNAKGSLNRFWRSLTKEQRAAVDTVAMDMWEAYRNPTLRNVPEAARKARPLFMFGLDYIKLDKLE